nr:hypothetical protein [Bradyrhizobium canariense]
MPVETRRSSKSHPEQPCEVALIRKSRISRHRGYRLAVSQQLSGAVQPEKDSESMWSNAEFARHQSAESFAAAVKAGGNFADPPEVVRQSSAELDFIGFHSRRRKPVERDFGGGSQDIFERDLACAQPRTLDVEDVKRRAGVSGRNIGVKANRLVIRSRNRGVQHSRRNKRRLPC